LQKLFRFLAKLNFFWKNVFVFWAGEIFLEKTFEVFAGTGSNFVKGVQFLTELFFCKKTRLHHAPSILDFGFQILNSIQNQ